jgi:hypothetical protein
LTRQSGNLPRVNDDPSAPAALVAGQVFDRYPEQLPLEHVAENLSFNVIQYI